ncbi:hypothetical protein F4009_00120 [Candidatus Poribacteria bacterium]|nr:hypothetical protein [Candidatus Poribacteria bacterium]MYH83380.1 hypothetical protein [Candidatus Poribacteria bacterium]MYK92405.1 hypothetical protein [Candidatus Poribacteria bacterium]
MPPTTRILRVEQFAIRKRIRYRTVLRTNRSILTDPLKPHLIGIAVVKQVHYSVYCRSETDLPTRDKDRHRLELFQLLPVLADRSVNNITLVFQLLHLLVRCQQFAFIDIPLPFCVIKSRNCVR